MKLYQEENKNIIYQAQYKDPFFEYLTSKIFSCLGKKKGRVLDLGCGGGRNIIAVAKRGFSVVGVDISQKALSVAQAQVEKEGLERKVRLIEGNMLKFRPCQLGLFDYCILSEVIEHLDNYQKAIDFAYSSLKKGGILIMTTPNDPKQWNLLDEYAGHLRRFTIEELKTTLKSFKKVKIYTVGFPFHRTVIALYHLMLKLQNKKHQPSTFRGRGFVSKLYNFFGPILLRIDDLFNFSKWGTTIVALATK